MKEAEHVGRQPFGQIPSYEEGDLVLFESGAIVLHIADSHPGLFPTDRDGRARAISWMFAAVNTIEPVFMDREVARFLESDKPWYRERLAMIDERVRKRLGDLSRRLGDGEWLDGAFSAGDLEMISVLLRSRSSGILDEYENLTAYVARGEARPAYQRAFAAQRAVFEATLAG
jgi:glutathione S-transferase